MAESEELWIHAVYLRPGDRIRMFGGIHFVVKEIESNGDETVIHCDTSEVPAGENAFISLTVRNDFKFTKVTLNQ